MKKVKILDLRNPAKMSLNQFWNPVIPDTQQCLLESQSQVCGICIAGFIKLKNVNILEMCWPREFAKRITAKNHPDIFS